MSLDEELNLYLELRSNEFSIDYTADGNKTSAVIHMDLSPTVSTAVLEIGKKHVFARRSKRPFLAFLGKRRIGHFSLSVLGKSELPAEESEKFGLSNARIGWLACCRYKSCLGLRAYLLGRIFVSDELHESLRNLLQAEKRLSLLRLRIEFENEGALKCEREDHGLGPISHLAWNLDNKPGESYLHVKSIAISLRRWGLLRSLLFFLLDHWVP